MSRPFSALALATLLVSACATQPRPRPTVAVVEPEAPAATGWEAIATPADRTGIAALTAGWANAKQAAGRRGARRMAEEGELLAPDAALELPALSPGSYHCRLVRIGARAGFRAYPPDFCSVEGNSKAVSLTKQTGERLFGGWLHADGERRQVFLGTVRPDADTAAPPYGLVPARDVSGVVERIGPFRWRLVPTRAGGGAMLDVYELVPIVPLAPAPQASLRRTRR